MRRLTPSWPMVASPEPVGPCVWGGWCPVGGGVWEWEGCAMAQNRLTNLGSRLVCRLVLSRTGP